MNRTAFGKAMIAFDLSDAMERLVERAAEKRNSTRDGSAPNKPLPVNNGN